MSPDLAARKVIVASYCYYRLGVSLMTDPEFDELCVIVAMGWDQLQPIRQWQLDSPEAILASGFHIKYTPMSESVAWTLARESNQPITGYVIQKWNTHKTYGRWGLV